MELVPFGTLTEPVLMLLDYPSPGSRYRIRRCRVSRSLPYNVHQPSSLAAGNDVRRV